MSLIRAAAPVDLLRVKAALGSGEERLCAAILKTVPGSGEGTREWKRAVCLLLLGREGERLSERDPFTEHGVVLADWAQTLALRSILQGMAASPAAPLRGVAIDPRLLRRPLFGLSSPDEFLQWGALGRAELAGAAGTDSELVRLLREAGARGLDLVSWSTRADP
jgi:hypothetical protein